jgi:hypothetical protein
MSARPTAGGHTLLEKWKMLQAILERDDLGSTAKIAAAKLLDHRNTKTGRCDPSYARLGKGIGVSRRAAMDAVKQLNEAGIVKIQPRGGPNGQRSNSFDFDWTMGWSTAPRQSRGAKKRTTGTKRRTTKGADSSTPASVPDDTRNHEITHEKRIRESSPSMGLDSAEYPVDSRTPASEESSSRLFSWSNIEVDLDHTDRQVLRTLEDELQRQRWHQEPLLPIIYALGNGRPKSLPELRDLWSAGKLTGGLLQSTVSDILLQEASRCERKAAFLAQFDLDDGME